MTTKLRAFNTKECRSFNEWRIAYPLILLFAEIFLQSSRLRIHFILRVQVERIMYHRNLLEEPFPGVQFESNTYRIQLFSLVRILGISANQFLWS